MQCFLLLPLILVLLLRYKVLLSKGAPLLHYIQRADAFVVHCSTNESLDQFPPLSSADLIFFLLLPVQHGRLRFTVIRCGTVLLMAGLRVLACELLNSGATSLWLSASSHLNVECHSISMTSNLTVSPLHLLLLPPSSDVPLQPTACPLHRCAVMFSLLFLLPFSLSHMYRHKNKLMLLITGINIFYLCYLQLQDISIHPCSLTLIHSSLFIIHAHICSVRLRENIQTPHRTHLPPKRVQTQH